MLVLNNARILTLDPARPHCTALAVQGGQIVMTGSDAEVLANAPKDAERRDLNGKTVWPGLTDAHLHLEYYSLGLQKVDCETAERRECLRRIGERAHQTPPGEWILGHGWNQNVWPEGFGSAADLDAVAPDHPVYLTAKSLHAAWANSRAIQLAGIGANTPDPPGGVLQRDAQGQPTGVLFESAMQLVERTIPEPTIEQVTAAIDAAQPSLWRMGLTGVHDFDRRRSFAALQTLLAEDRLWLRVVKGIPFEDLPYAVALGLRSGFGHERLRIGSVKMFADGALGPQTAAMLQPYENTATTGMAMLDEEDIFEAGRLAAQSGLSLAIHAIGDAANHAVLNGYAQLRAFETDQRLPHLRHRIEHVQLIHPDDIPRLSSLGVIASMQPVHATSDMLIADRYWGARAATAYAWRSLRQAGAALVFGSDAPVESPDPFRGLYAAITRRREDGSPSPEGWRPEQRLSLEAALAGFTTGAAYAAGLEKQGGKLAPGYFADLIVLPEDPFQGPPEQLLSIQTEATMVSGRWVWQAQ